MGGEAARERLWLRCSAETSVDHNQFFRGPLPNRIGGGFFVLALLRSGSRLQIPNSKFQIQDSKSRIANRQSQIGNRKSAIANRPSQIDHRKSIIANSMIDSPSKIPSGIRYYFGDEARSRRAIEEAAMAVFNGWSYEEIVTPTVDYFSLFDRGMGREAAQRAFKFTDADGELLALRPDVTSAIARAAATLMSGRQRPLRFCYAAPVFRATPESHAEWRRELTQIGAELIGRNDIAADMEVLIIANEILSCLGLNSDCTITLNDLEVFNGVVNGLKLDPEQRELMRQLIDTRNRSDLKCFLAARTSEKESEEFADLVTLAGKGEVFPLARAVITNSRSLAALDRLEALWQIIESLDLTDRFEIDLGDLSKIDYYTGLVFKIYVAGAGKRVGSGGRYDQLTASFGKAEPAIGFVLDLEVMAEALIAAQRSVIAPEQAAEAVRLSDTNPTELFRRALQCRASRERIVIGEQERIWKA
jgi:ATP phosphoribosyltransferase regulatory subunit